MTYRVYRLARTVGGAARAGLSGRSFGDALAGYRLRSHPRWRTLATDAPVLTREEFHRHYAAAFPGAEFTDSLDPAVCAMTSSGPAT